MRSAFIRQTGDPVAPQQMVLQALDRLRQTPAAAFAYFDTFFVFALVSAGLSVLVLLMKRSVAEKGTRIAAE